MNRYPLWVYVTIAVALRARGSLHAAELLRRGAGGAGFSGPRDAESGQRGSRRVEEALKKAGVQPTGVFLDLASIKVRLADTDTQLKAKDLIDQALNPDAANPSYTVALNLLPNSPMALRAAADVSRPGLRGGVHFLLQVDMRAAIAKRAEGLAGDIRSQLRDKNVRHAGIAREATAS